MNLTYSLRLACICFSSFFLVQAVVGAIVSIAARGAIQAAGGMRPRFAARFLFSVRMMPLGLAGFVVFGLCVPSYLRLEPNVGGEQVGWACVAMALLGAATCFGSVTRMIVAMARSRQYGKACEQMGRETHVGEDSIHATIIPQEGALLAIAGIFRSRLIVSSNVLQALTDEELDAALRHERAHRIWRDNFKRLLFVGAPRGVGLWRGLEAIERQWSKFAEWAADDFSTGGDLQRALSLAGALIRIARLGTIAAQTAIVSSFAQGGDLSERVDRLLRAAPKPLPGKISGKIRIWMGGLAVVTAFSVGAAIVWPASLSTVHYLLERLID